MKSRTLKTLAILIALAMIVSPVSAAIAPTPVEARGSLPPRDDLVPTGSTSTDKFTVEEATSLEQYVVNKDGTLGYIVLFEGDSLVKVSGGAKGSAINSIESRNYLDHLAENRESILSQAEKTIGRSIQVYYVYDVILNGVSVDLTPEEAEALRGVPGIKKVLKDTIHTLDTDAGPAWLGAPEIWDGTAVPDEVGTKGEGILVGILDTGINFDHPSFSDTPADGYVYEWTGDYLGVCALDGDPLYANACNDKLVGAYTYTKESETLTPEDSEGHGSHTASTVAGNTVDLEFYGTEVTVSGMAPRAQIVAYDVCYSAGCWSSDSIAAVQQAIEDGVDVINYSISGGEDPYNDFVELAFLEATAAGIVVSTSAGNSGPAAETVAHRSPWVLSTAASSHNRKFTSIVNFSNEDYQGIATLAGEYPFTEELLNKPVIFAGEDDDNDLGCEEFPTDFFAGSIALIKRGTCTFTVKVLNAEAAGADGVLMYTDDRAPGAMTVEDSSIPNVMLDIPGTVGDAIAAWVASATDDTVSISAYGRYVDDAFGDFMADFSSRGPNTTFDVLKPDVSAPGLEVLAAVKDGTIDPSPGAELDLYQGTSMSSPHDAGAAALLKALHPDWTPAKIKSALMLTAYDGLLKEDKTTPADPFDIGAGRIQLELAGLTGLVMDETIANYEAADPALGGDPRSLNLASLYHSECVGECSWTRTFTSVADLPATYIVSAPAWIAVEPDTFTIAPGATQEITITANVAAAPTDEWLFGKVEFITEDTFSGESSVILEEGFETSVPPTDWIELSLIEPGWRQGTTGSTGSNQTPHSGDYYAWHNDDSGTDDAWLISPQIIIPASVPSTLTFWEANYWTGLYYELHELLISTGSCSPVDEEFVSVAEFNEVAATWTLRTIDLSSFGGQEICFAFHYEGTYADEWYIDDVKVSAELSAGAPISDVAIPVAVLPTTGNLPDFAKFDSHRDADSGTLVDLQAVEITDLTVDTYGFVKGELHQIQLAQDPTNGSPYDNLDQVWFTVIPMDAGAARLVAEITATTAVDLDLYWGFDLNGDGLPSANEEYGNSATATAYEYLSEWGFPAPFYGVWILVQNWQGSGAPLDDITLSIGNVPYAPADPATMTVIGPETNPAGEPFTLDILWHDIDTEAGDRLYGLIDVYADAEYETAIGLTQVDIRRGVDDVVKTADVETATVGDVITYTIEVTNFATGPTEYAINDVLPEGVTYVPDSATGGAVYDADQNAILWNGTIAAVGYDYVMSTSTDNPVCAMPLANIGVENADGTVGTLVSYNDPNLAIEDGSAICFDYVLVPPVRTITFQVVVDEDTVTGPLTNVALHSTDRLGTAEEAATAVVDLTIIKNIYLPIISR